MISKVKWVWYGMDFSEKPSGEELSVKERRFVGPSCECWDRREEGDRKGKGIKG